MNLVVLLYRFEDALGVGETEQAAQEEQEVWEGFLLQAEKIEESLITWKSGFRGKGWGL